MSDEPTTVPAEPDDDEEVVYGDSEPDDDEE